jgi:hypothetical protein
MEVVIVNSSEHACTTLTQVVEKECKKECNTITVFVPDHLPHTPAHRKYACLHARGKYQETVPLLTTTVGSSQTYYCVVEKVRVPEVD